MRTGGDHITWSDTFSDWSFLWWIQRSVCFWQEPACSGQEKALWSKNSASVPKYLHVLTLARWEQPAESTRGTYLLESLCGTGRPDKRTVGTRSQYNSPRGWGEEDGRRRESDPLGLWCINKCRPPRSRGLSPSCVCCWLSRAPWWTLSQTPISALERGNAPVPDRFIGDKTWSRKTPVPVTLLFIVYPPGNWSHRSHFLIKGWCRKKT